MTIVAEPTYIRMLGIRIDLAEGITTTNGWTLMYASFATIGFLTFVNTGQAFILNANLGVARDDQGVLSGNLAFWNEIITMALAAPFGVLADKVGRRPLFCFGLIAMALGYALYPLADSITDLTIARSIYAVGTAAAAGMLGTVGADYPREHSRGKLIAWTGVFNSLGVIFTAFVFGRVLLPLFENQYGSQEAGTYTFWLLAIILVLSALILHLGLKGGTPAGRHDQPPLIDLVRAGFRNAKNPRIALAYSSAFVARGDLVIIGVFLTLWGTQAGIERGMEPGQAAREGATIFILAQIFGLFWSPIMGFFIDRVNRVSATIFGSAMASLGYMSMGFIDDPLNRSWLPLFAILGIGQISAFFASQALVGQEAPYKERGAVVGMFSLCGALGILVCTSVGGVLFDDWMKSGPFVFVGFLNLFVLLFAVIVRIKSPGISVT